MTNIYHRIFKKITIKETSVEISVATLSCRVPLASTAALIHVPKKYTGLLSCTKDNK